MPRDLGDVLHWFAPELGGAARADGAATLAPLIGVPLASADAVRCALLWNLAVEAARQGARAALAAAPQLDLEPGWPAGGAGPLGVEWLRAPAEGPDELARVAQEALRRASGRGRPLVLAALPHAWLEKGAEAPALLGWTLALVRPDETELGATWTALEAIATQSPGARLGVTVFGVRGVAEARGCFECLADAAERRLGCALTSYGVLADDVHLSRSLVTGRPVALASPQAASSRALADVARLLLEDAHGRADG